MQKLCGVLYILHEIYIAYIFVPPCVEVHFKISWHFFHGKNQYFEPRFKYPVEIILCRIFS